MHDAYSSKVVLDKNFQLKNIYVGRLCLYCSSTNARKPFCSSSVLNFNFLWTLYFAASKISLNFQHFKSFKIKFESTVGLVFKVKEKIAMFETLQPYRILWRIVKLCPGFSSSWGRRRWAPWRWWRHASSPLPVCQRGQPRLESSGRFSSWRRRCPWCRRGWSAAGRPWWLPVEVKSGEMGLGIKPHFALGLYECSKVLNSLFWGYLVPLLLPMPSGWRWGVVKNFLWLDCALTRPLF